MNLSRRSFLKGAAYAAGAAFGTRVLGGLRGGIEGVAKADGEAPALVIVYLRGGYNACFSSAGNLTGKFGVTASNVTALANGLIVDSATLGSLPDVAKTKMATIGVNHGLTDHDDNQMQKWWSKDNRSYVLRLAAAMGGDAPLKAAIVGDRRLPGARPPEANGTVTMQSVLDMEPTIAALGAAQSNERVPGRDVTAAVLERSAAMSKGLLERNKGSLVSLHEAYPTTSSVLRRPELRFSFPDLSSAYGLNGAMTVSSFASQIAAAELLVTAGANVVVAVDDDETWDSHGVPDSETDRNLMTTRIMPPLKTLVSRMMSDPQRNLVVAIFGDFARSLPDSDHQPNCAVTVMGKYVKAGSTGQVNASMAMPPNTPDIEGLWSYLAEVVKAPENPFGPNPHGLVLR